MPVQKFRDISEMPSVWDDKSRPGSLRQTLEISRLCLELARRRNISGVRRYHSIEEAQRDDPNEI